ncbi:MAG: hypothetical protein H0T89_05860 [Deltaproteobacteria bacterium]|nr:hypothetical protein [Deltaproteobacteria bacterium]MDQ3301362.1 hypothetical protein [Myxococcota bacterium]
MAKRKTPAQRRQEAIDAVARENREFWGLTELDERILTNTLSRSGRGLYDPDLEERRASFWDAWDCLWKPEGGLQPVAKREINGLLATCASAPIPVAIRACAALLLATIANAAAPGGGANEPVLRELAAKLVFLEESLVVEIVDELPPEWRPLFALICAPVDFARSSILARMPPAARDEATAVFAGERAAAKGLLARMTVAVLG